ncbi:hypothetical protein BPBIEBS31_90 [Mycobacterium phage BPBiebs31]|uniref:Uncharacterized protein n=1 Tax=Mycobacterium phage BPBiebs31 TaxID=2902900 RepID=G1DA43_9CAUD|nr:hypothetical protein FGG18_gp12 [Mycobacterium phage BPBiebs31]AEJ91945.1 hypothetical protein BPBIEBS31_90 [Mycobacterium phage BPBiebs31]AYD81061.1 hypothetical protein SEA_ARCANINE_89 [Mycobacterium phage Arcanine]QEA11546.1 hypothetical protein SEA_ANGLERFISH_88 [Mycobacterium phage Anglerfish]WGH20286.1 hypothetical protein SLAGATHOR_86 [Mycobacterium phage Slagathor]
MIITIAKTEDRRDLDASVREIYDEFSTAADTMHREHYTMLIRGGANALHRRGSIIVPRLREDMDEPVVVRLDDAS